MKLVLFPASSVDIALHQLPELGMVVDPRPNGFCPYKLKVTVEGKNLIVTRIDPPEDRQEWDHATGWSFEMRFRVYYSNEQRYSFESTKYLYHGHKYEQAPRNATEIVVKDGLQTIYVSAFYECKSLAKVNIPNSVTRILDGAFLGCYSLRFVQLPPNLQAIGKRTFSGCILLKAVYLPPTVREVGEHAFSGCHSLEAVYLPPILTYLGGCTFSGCKSLRIVNIPSVQKVNPGFRMYSFVEGCDGLLTCDYLAPDTKIKRGSRVEHARECNNWFRRRFNSLHKLCYNPSPSPQAIQQYIQDHNDNEERARTKDKPHFTALHLLAANPYVTGKLIKSYIQLAPDVAVMQDNIGMTPLHMLCSVPYFSDGTYDAIAAYLSFSEGKDAACMMDYKGRTPLDCIYSEERKLFSLGKYSFGDLMVWWCDCWGIRLSMEDTDGKESRKRKSSCSDT